jgi:hypothetical protein
MIRLIIMLLPLLLLGCGTGSLDSQVKDVQAAAVKACGFLPTASSVAAILSAGNPAVTGVTAVATAICAAVTKVAPQARGLEQECPRVNGVCVEGEFVPKDQTKP